MRKKPFLIAYSLLAVSIASASAPSAPPSPVENTTNSSPLRFFEKPPSVNQTSRPGTQNSKVSSPESFEVGALPATTPTPAKNIDITGTSLSELMSIKITSIIGKPQDIQNTAAAIYVITNDEIKRMGVTQLAETLRYVPGVQVARTGANDWAISVRGFNGISSNKLLVTIDGRNIYSSLYGGVLWQQQDLLLDDIDRIEIIRGPGGVTWGTNAVNGVINFITKSSRDTQGVFVKGGDGTINELAEARAGFKIADDTYGRVYTKASHEKSSTNIAYSDRASMLQTGFRIDRYSTAIGDMTLQGDIYRGNIGPDLLGLSVHPNSSANAYNGNNLLFNWFYNETVNRSHSVLAYIDNANINNDGNITDHRVTMNFNYQIIQRLKSQEFTWGIGARRTNDHVGELNTSTPGLTDATLIPTSKIDRLYTSFIQDNIALLQNKAHLIIGTKYEHNDYTKSEWQPSVRISYAHDDSSLLWGAWSRALRIPMRIEEDRTVLPFVPRNTHLIAEAASVYEIGWRKAWPIGMDWNMTAYTSKYTHLITPDVNATPFQIIQSNKMSGRVSGIELGPNFQIRPDWLVRLNYSYAIAHMHISGISVGNSSKKQAIERVNLLPRNMAEALSMWDINERWQLNAGVRYMGSLRPGPSDGFVTVGSYTVADVSVLWKSTKHISLQLAARDLGRKHLEWGASTVTPLVAPSYTLFLTVNL